MVEIEKLKKILQQIEDNSFRGIINIVWKTEGGADVLLINRKASILMLTINRFNAEICLNHAIKKLFRKVRGKYLRW